LNVPAEFYFTALPRRTPPKLQRSTCFRIFTIDRPDLLDDILYPQVEKLRKIIVAESRSGGFHPIDSDTYLGKKISVLVELESDTRPAFKIHIGPPASSQETRNFMEKWKNSDHLRGPFIMEGRPVVEAHQETRYNEVLIRVLMDKDIGAHLNQARDSIRISAAFTTRDQKELLHNYIERNMSG
ncbi:tRNA CCA-pyrophosphorylase, partial [mine drainage metagenome]